MSRGIPSPSPSQKSQATLTRSYFQHHPMDRVDQIACMPHDPADPSTTLRLKSFPPNAPHPRSHPSAKRPSRTLTVNTSGSVPLDIASTGLRAGKSEDNGCWRIQPCVKALERLPSRRRKSFRSLFKTRPETFFVFSRPFVKKWNADTEQNKKGESETKRYKRK